MLTTTIHVHTVAIVTLNEGKMDSVTVSIDPVATLRRAMEAMSDHQRKLIIDLVTSGYCRECGAPLPCYCRLDI